MSTEYHQTNVQSDQHSNDVIDLRIDSRVIKKPIVFITFIVALCLVLADYMPIRDQQYLSRPL